MIRLKVSKSQLQLLLLMTRDVLEQEDREPESQDQVQFNSKTISKSNKNMLLWNFWIFGPHFWMHRAQSAFIQQQQLQTILSANQVWIYFCE